MSQLIRRTYAWLLALVVVGALSLGARSLLAMPANLDCPDPPNNGGTCANQEECELNCGFLFPGYDHAICGINGCCRCFL